VSGFSLKRFLLTERGRGHESGAGGTSAEGQNREPDRACERARASLPLRVSLRAHNASHGDAVANYLNRWLW